MAREVFSFKKLFKVIRQSNRIKLDDVTINALNSARVNIAVNKIQAMQVLQALGYLLYDLKNIINLEFSLAKGLPLSEISGRFHFNIY